MKDVTMKNKLLNTVFGLFALLMFTACGKIRSAYQGDFTDQATSAKLTLGGSGGSLMLSSGREIKGSTADVKYEKLVASEPGIYVRPSQSNSDVVEIFWLQQNKESRKEEASFVWQESEILYTRMNTKLKDKVQQLKMVHCEKGLLELDLANKTWNGGCPTDQRTEYDFVRTK